MSKNSKKHKGRGIIITISVIILLVIAGVALSPVLIPKIKLFVAERLLESGNYGSAYPILVEIGSGDVIDSNKHDRAMAQIDYGNYEAGYALLNEIGREDEIVSNKHDRAMTLIDSGDYETGYALLKEIGREDEIISNKYDRAMNLIDTGDYETGYALLAEIGNEDAIDANKYDRAISLMDSGKYEDAFVLLNGLDYEGGPDKAKECLYHIQMDGLSNIEVGSTIKFGFYEQDNKTSDGKEEIEWIVLEIEDGKALVVSKYALDCQMYRFSSNGTITWETSDLRSWCNGWFYSSAFGSEQQDMIVETMVTADENPECDRSPGDDTTDKIFILSLSEVEQYFSTNEERMCLSTPYAVANGAKSYAAVGSCDWWVRTPGEHRTYMVCVGVVGNIYYNGLVGCLTTEKNTSGKQAVRPAMWISLA